MNSLIGKTNTFKLGPPTVRWNSDSTALVSAPRRVAIPECSFPKLQKKRIQITVKPLSFTKLAKENGGFNVSRNLEKEKRRTFRSRRFQRETEEKTEEASLTHVIILKQRKVYFAAQFKLTQSSLLLVEIIVKVKEGLLPIHGGLWPNDTRYISKMGLIMAKWTQAICEVRGHLNSQLYYFYLLAKFQFLGYMSKR
ncbi:hypothetical protein L1049_022402 [Liquidambar formosana]|uniref:Uncharacterized protein n=1 Tax=Liquidambar formosana TaxID=63359 RepID=A0AAP0REF3_LIQFO